MATDALTRFSESLLTEANKTRQTLISDLENDRKKRLSDENTNIMATCKHRVKIAKFKLMAEQRMTISSRQNELNASMIENRTRFFNEIFTEVTKNIREFVKSDKYENYISAEFAKYSKDFSDGTTVCTVMTADLYIIKKLCTLKNVEFKTTDDTEFVGGFTLENQQLKLFADCTFKDKIEEQKKIFYENGGLIIE
ncbi:MAG: hypothetical protein RSC29_04485 [Oscillospiraceae bacterium]